MDDHLHIFITEEGLERKVKDFIAQKTKLNSAAIEAIVIDEIPKNDAGKLLYVELEKYYQ